MLHAFIHTYVHTYVHIYLFTIILSWNDIVVVAVVVVTVDDDDVDIVAVAIGVEHTIAIFAVAATKQSLKSDIAADLNRMEKQMEKTQKNVAIKCS